jgi:hypothetical protein
MAKWKLFGKSKPREEDIIEPVKTTEETLEEPIDETKEIVETENKIENEPLAEHHETLETGVSTTKQSPTTQPSDQRLWRDVNSIEGEIDDLHKTRAHRPISEVDKAVDKLITKRRRK